MRRPLVICQAVDADATALGFFVGWLAELSRQVERLAVIGQSVGRHDLPSDVVVGSMGKEQGISKIRQLSNLWSFLRRELPAADAIFVHMSPEYALVAWPLAAFFRKPIVLWYAHRSVTWRLRLATWLCDRVLTIATGSFLLNSGKVQALGHGIPTGLFTPGAPVREPWLLSVGRITRIKRLEVMIEALASLRPSVPAATLTLVGDEVTADDRTYRRELGELAERLGVSGAVIWAGKTRYVDLPAVYRMHALHLNLAPTGALDKAVLEAMSCGVPVVVANRNFAETFGHDAERLIVETEPRAVAIRLEGLLKNPDAGLPTRLRAAVEAKHSLQALIRGIMASV